MRLEIEACQGHRSGQNKPGAPETLAQSARCEVVDGRLWASAEGVDVTGTEGRSPTQMTGGSESRGLLQVRRLRGGRGDVGTPMGNHSLSGRQ